MVTYAFKGVAVAFNYGESGGQSTGTPGVFQGAGVGGTNALVAPLAGDGGVLLKRAIALARPSYIFLAVPQGVGELGDNAAVV